MADDKPEQKDTKLVRAKLIIRLTREEAAWHTILLTLVQNFLERYPELINLLSEDKQNKFIDFVKERTQKIIDSIPILLAQEFNEAELDFLLLLIGNIYIQKFLHLMKLNGKINTAIISAIDQFQEDLFNFINSNTSTPPKSNAN